MQKSKCLARYRVVVRPVVEVQDHYSLRFLWAEVKAAHHEWWIEEIRVKEPLTKRELSRLPKVLRAKLA